MKVFIKHYGASSDFQENVLHNLRSRSGLRTHVKIIPLTKQLRSQLAVSVVSLSLLDSYSRIFGTLQEELAAAPESCKPAFVS